MSKSIPSRILIIEDDPAISAVMRYYLNKEGYRLTSITDASDAVNVIRRNKPDLVILDWMLVDYSGVDILIDIRKDKELQNLPVIMVSSKDAELDKLTGLYKGADDYVVKPFAPVELSARIHAIFRRIRPIFTKQVLKFDDIEMDLSAYEVRRGGVALKFAPIEFQILQALIEQPGRVLSRQYIMNKIWGPDVDVGVRTIDVHVTRLRSTLMSQSTRPGIDVIKTVRVMGYVMRLDDHEKRDAKPSDKPVGKPEKRVAASNKKVASAAKSKGKKSVAKTTVQPKKGKVA